MSSFATWYLWKCRLSEAVPIHLHSGIATPSVGHAFNRRVDPETLERLDTPAQVDSWNRTWTFFEWHLRPGFDASKPAPAYRNSQLNQSIGHTVQGYPILLRWWIEQNVRGRHIWPGLIPNRVGNPARENWPIREILGQINVTRAQPGATGHIHFSMRTFLPSADPPTTPTGETRDTVGRPLRVALGERVVSSARVLHPSGVRISLAKYWGCLHDPSSPAQPVLGGTHERAAL